jgi:hypothetical protein
MHSTGLPYHLGSNERLDVEQQMLFIFPSRLVPLVFVRIANDILCLALLLFGQQGGVVLPVDRGAVVVVIAIIATQRALTKLAIAGPAKVITTRGARHVVAAIVLFDRCAALGTWPTTGSDQVLLGKRVCIEMRAFQFPLHDRD